jgi:filamentous hemagglutinin
LAAQASITLVNNKGDIGKTLKDMSTSSTIKAALAAALTAGVLDKLSSTGFMGELSKTGQFADKLTYNLINATGRALTTTAINGGDLQGALKAALVGGMVDTAHGEAASFIGRNVSDYLAHKLAHALAGCVEGAGQNLNVDPEQELQGVHLAQGLLNRSHVRCRKLSKVLAEARFVYCAQLVA